MESLEIAKNAANTAVERNAEEVLILEVQPLTTVADYFVLASAATRVQTKDISEKIEDALQQSGVEKLRIQGRDEAGWILLDYGSVVIHIFLRQEREFYDLEERWKDATVVFDSSASPN